MSKVVIMDHPLIQHKLGVIRQKETTSSDFRKIVKEITILMCYEATESLELEDIAIETPICPTTAKQISGKKLVVVPILRAGLAMVDGIQECIPKSRVGHIGLYRDHDTHQPVEYYCKLPQNCDERQIFLLDPMLATGGSVIKALDMLKEHGCKSIRLMSLIAAPEGVRAVQEAHPDVDLYIGALDSHLNEDKYIVPGLGDAGDRIFGTK